MNKAVTLLPTVFGAILGILLLRYPTVWAFVVLVVLAALLFGLRRLGERNFRRSRTGWRYALEPWIGVLIIATALAVSFLLWVTVLLDPTTVAQATGWNDDQKGDLIKFLAGTFTGVAAALVSEDREKNWFWPDYHFKRWAESIAPKSSTTDSARYHAGRMDCTLDNKICGWGFAARGGRARILASDALAAKKTAEPIEPPASA